MLLKGEEENHLTFLLNHKGALRVVLTVVGCDKSHCPFFYFFHFGPFCLFCSHCKHHVDLRIDQNIDPHIEQEQKRRQNKHRLDRWEEVEEEESGEVAMIHFRNFRNCCHSQGSWSSWTAKDMTAHESLSLLCFVVACFVVCCGV